MKKKKALYLRISMAILLFVALFGAAPAADSGADAVSLTGIEEKINHLMDKADIPGLTLVVVKGDQPVLIKGFGYADLEKKIPVTPETLFELGSTSKAFTALAVLKLESEGLLDLDSPVSKYLDWFYVTLNGEKTPVTLRQLLHHTSGLPPWKTLAAIPESDAPDALRQTVLAISGMELERPPGVSFGYVTANYDILGAVMEVVSGMSYEDYMAKHIFQPLDLTHTRVGADKSDPAMAVGYKLGIFSQRAYDAPVYRGNYPAGYVVSNGRDVGRWLRVQLGLVDNSLAPLVEKSHRPDMSVNPVAGPMTSYAAGWRVYKYGSDLVEHGGDNPNFNAHMAFRPGEKTAVAVLSNSRHVYGPHIAHVVMQHVRGKSQPTPLEPGRSIGGTALAVSIGLGIFLLATLVFILSILWGALTCKRELKRVTAGKLLRMGLTLVSFIPFIIGIYLMPLAMRNLPWKVAAVWTPDSFLYAAYLVLIAMAVSYIAYVLSAFLPMKNKYQRSAPMIVVLSFMSGGANAVVIFLITSSLFTRMELIYQVYFYLSAFYIYILGRKIIQTRLTEITFEIVYDLRMRLIDKVFRTSYQRFEKMERGRVYATLNDDSHQIARVANVLTGLVTSLITATCAFFYLFTIAFWASALTLAVVVTIAGIYYTTNRRARKLFEEARDTRNAYMGLLNGMLDGFKELSIRYNKRKRYTEELEKVSRDFTEKTSFANIKFINSFLVGESLLLGVLGAVSFAVPRMFPDISVFTLMSFIMVLLYLIGPVNVILGTIPAIAQIRVAWGRVLRFERDMPVDIERGVIPDVGLDRSSVTRIKASGVTYSYEGEDGGEGFSVGPIEFEARKGEITFIVGGNGSGKTTFAKLLTGLYTPEEGYIQIEGKDIDNQYPGEYFSTVFSGFHLFDKLYDADPEKQEKEADKYIKMLHLEEKVSLDGDTFSTTALSGGQRKRLALLQCYLENKPIYLFDEVAADQDPEFRKFFYRDLLMRMKKEGKIVIAITHDDHYFDVADRIVKMDMGNLVTLDAGATLRVTN